MIERLRRRDEYQFFRVLPSADPRLATAWWLLLVLRGVLPAVFTVTIGVLVNAVNDGDPLGGPLAAVGIVFVLVQLLSPLHAQAGATWARSSRRG
jgi:ATP-binding cassette subfamily B protein